MGADLDLDEEGQAWKSRYRFFSLSIGRALRVMPMRNTLSASVSLDHANEWFINTHYCFGMQATHLPSLSSAPANSS